MFFGQNIVKKSEQIETKLTLLFFVIFFEGISFYEIANDERILSSATSLVSTLIFKTRASSDAQILLTITSTASTNCQAPSARSVTNFTHSGMVRNACSQIMLLQARFKTQTHVCYVPMYPLYSKYLPLNHIRICAVSSEFF